MPALTLTGIAAMRGGRQVLADVALTLGAGEAALVTGPNGAGKSTLVRIAAGLLRPAAGRVTRCGTLALLGEGHALDPERPLGSALAFWIGGDRAAAALEMVGLAAISALPVRMLSTGQRRRAGLARVIGSQAAIWLLDEPANGLDTAATAMLTAALAAHRARGGIAVVATHQPIALPGAVSLVLG